MSCRNLVEIHVATALFGLAGLFGKWLSLPPTLIVFGRVVFASLILALILLAKKQGGRPVSRRSCCWLFFLGGILALHWVTFFRSIQLSSVAVGLLAYASFPVFTIFFEPLATGDKFDGLNLIPAAICLAGIFFIVPRFSQSDATFQGVSWGLVSGMTFAVLTVANRRLIRKYSSLTIAFYEDLAAAVFLSPFVFFSPRRIAAKDVLLLAALGVACTAGAHTLFISGMRRVKAQAASIISSLEPVYGIALALVLLGERPSLRALCGGAVILMAVIAVSLREARRRAPA